MKLYLRTKWLYSNSCNFFLYYYMLGLTLAVSLHPSSRRIAHSHKLHCTLLRCCKFTLDLFNRGHALSDHHSNLLYVSDPLVNDDQASIFKNHQETDQNIFPHQSWKRPKEAYIYSQYSRILVWYEQNIQGLMKLSIPPPLCLDGLPLADLEAGGADDVVVGVEPQLQGVHGLRLGEVGDEEVDAVVVGGRQPGPAVPLPDAVCQRDDAPVEDLHVHGAAGDEQLQAQGGKHQAEQEWNGTQMAGVRVML